MLPTSEFLTFIKEKQLFSASDKVLLAVSGGRDSVLMAQLFNASGFAFGIAHCNFSLRAEESDTDETFVMELAAKLRVPFHSIRFDTASFARDNKISTQMAARELRYNWFEELRLKEGYSYVALAHHGSDTTETMLLNLVRGTGVAGLHGILPKRGSIIRPLLFLTREDIDKIVALEKIPYREDSSNLSTKYARNKIRLELIPVLKQLNPGIDETFKLTSERFAELEEFLDQQVLLLREKIFKEQRDGSIMVLIDELKGLRPQKLLLFNLFKPYGFSEAVLRDLIYSWDGQPGKKFESTSYLLILDRKKLYLLPRSQKTEEASIISEDRETGTALTLKNMALTWSEKDAEGLILSADQDIAMLDADLLIFPLKIRYWEEGDCFYPLGMKGKKKLSDFFTHLKIPRHEKSTIPLLVNGNGDLVWIVGYRIDNRYKVSRQTKKVYIFEKHKLHGN